MRKLARGALAGVAAATLASTSFAASPNTHVMNVPLPDGSVARVEYVGDVAPKVTVAPRAVAGVGEPAATMPLPSFPDFGRMIAEMNQRSREIMRQAQQMSRQSPGAASYVAGFGNAPAGQTSTTVVSVSNGGKTCTRTTEVVSQGPGKPPKVTSNASGDCRAAPAAPAGPINPA